MNGVHDMGGMQGFGPIRPEKNEPVFHARWEGRMQAIWSALGAWRKWNGDFGRQTREFLPPAEYLALQLLPIALRAGRGVARRVAAWSRAPRSKADGQRKGRRRRSRRSPPARSRRGLPSGNPKRRDVAVAPTFQAGQRVRARNINPPTHTRLPRYARGKLGIIERDHGVFVFPDSNAQGLGEKPQHVYSVRFAARELWGEQAKPKDTVIVAMWDDYLEPA